MNEYIYTICTATVALSTTETVIKVLLYGVLLISAVITLVMRIRDALKDGHIDDAEMGEIREACDEVQENGDKIIDELGDKK